MARCVWACLRASDTKMAGRVREVYRTYSLKSFRLLEVIDEGPAITEIRVILIYENNCIISENQTQFRLIVNESDDGKPGLRGMPDSTWGVVNWGHATLSQST